MRKCINCEYYDDHSYEASNWTSKSLLAITTVTGICRCHAPTDGHWTLCNWVNELDWCGEYVEAVPVRGGRHELPA